MAKMCLSLVFAVLVALLMGLNPVKASFKEEDGVVADSSKLPEGPEESEEPEVPEKPLKMPGPCAGQSYCFEKGANYPEKKIKELLADMRELKVESTEHRTNIDSCNGDTFDEPDCRSNCTKDPIYYIIDKNDTVRVVVQSPERFQQIYSVKWCLDEGLITRDTPHFLKNSVILKKFKIECVSKKMDFDFFVLSDKVDPVSQKPMMEIATAKGGIPVCCRCRYNVDD